MLRKPLLRKFIIKPTVSPCMVAIMTYFGTLVKKMTEASWDEEREQVIKIHNTAAARGVFFFFTFLKF